MQKTSFDPPVVGFMNAMRDLKDGQDNTRGSKSVKHQDTPTQLQS